MSGTRSPANQPPADRAVRSRRWTPARQAAFLQALRETLSVSEAARSVGMSRQSAYKLRRRLAGQPFAEAWECAVADLQLAGEIETPAARQRCHVCGTPVRPAATPGRGSGKGDAWSRPAPRASRRALSLLWP